MSTKKDNPLIGSFRAPVPSEPPPAGPAEDKKPAEPSAPDTKATDSTSVKGGEGKKPAEPPKETAAPGGQDEEIPKDFTLPIAREGQSEIITTLKVDDIHARFVQHIFLQCKTRYTPPQTPETVASGHSPFDRYLRNFFCRYSALHSIMFVEVVYMTDNTQFKTLVNEWLNQKKPMITPSTHASFTLIAENHLIPHFGKRKIGSITEADIQNYISYLYENGCLDDKGGLTVKTIRDVILVLRLAMEYA